MIWSNLALIVLAWINAALAGMNVHRGRFGTATFCGLVAILCAIRSL